MTKIAPQTTSSQPPELTMSLYISGLTFGVTFMRPTKIKKKPSKSDRAVRGSDLIILSKSLKKNKKRFKKN
ncbi:hypothetical protein BpHYR1_034919 [Brachionus plicatilis]|uniref:Uncharacterized protein n=1 Tax=Brachionus plicatilis TaxID=10195 RepID=A0A3M7RYB4_BRAPC|nr:hypothetical protein BpHYR1_034919 [Brachionus plicatilis]